MEYTKKIEILQFSPCEDAVEFRKQYQTFNEAWENCPRGDWMLWLAKKLDVDLKTLTLAKVRCASTVRHLMKDQRSLTALDVALKFANGDASRKELDAAAADADAACGQNRKLTADICREVLTDIVFKKLNIKS